MGIALGLGFEICATIVGTAGKQLVRRSALVEDTRRARLLKYSGLFVTTVVGPVLDAAAYAFAPQSLVSPLNGMDIVWNTCFAPYTLGERLMTKHIAGTALIFAGASASSALGPHTQLVVTLELLQSLVLSRVFFGYCVAVVLALCVSAKVLSRHGPGCGSKTRGIALGCTAGGVAGNMTFTSLALGSVRHSFSTGDWSMWEGVLPYIVVLGALGVAILNIPFMTKGLQEYEALFMVTTFEGTQIFVSCISGQILLHEMGEYGYFRRACYWLAVSLIVIGLLVIQSAQHRSTGNPQEKMTLDDESPASILWAGGLSGVSVASHDLAPSNWQPCPE